MKRLTCASVLLASLAGAAHADDPDAALRARLARGDDGFWDTKLRSAVKSGAELAAAPGAAAIAVAKADRPIEMSVIDRRDHAHRVIVGALGARIALWVGDDGVVPAVTREVHVAASATAKPPGPDADGILLEPGVRVGERRGDRVHVVYTDFGAQIDGWIPADAVGAEYPQLPSLGDGWDLAPAGTKIVDGGRVLAVSDGDQFMRKLPHGRGELSRGYWHARGKLVLAKGDAGPDGVDGGVEGGVMNDVVDSVAANVAGACLYDGGGHLVGAVAEPGLLERVSRSKDGFDVAVHLVDAETITLHARRIDGAVERCLP